MSLASLASPSMTGTIGCSPGRIERPAAVTPARSSAWSIAASMAPPQSPQGEKKPFYKRLFNGMDPVIPEAEKFKVHAERIGDYTISLCA